MISSRKSVNGFFFFTWIFVLLFTRRFALVFTFYNTIKNAKRFSKFLFINPDSGSVVCSVFVSGGVGFVCEDKSNQQLIPAAAPHNYRYYYCLYDKQHKDLLLS